MVAFTACTIVCVCDEYAERLRWCEVAVSVGCERMGGTCSAVVVSSAYNVLVWCVG